MFDIITGMSTAYYNKVGKYMIDSFLQYWPEEFILTVYTEDSIPVKHPRIIIKDLNRIPGYLEFQNTIKLDKLQDRCKTFAKKAYPIIKHLHGTHGYLIWIDADVETIGEITTPWLLELIGENNFSCHFGVPQGKFYSVETGFFIINRDNAWRQDFLKRYSDTYNNKDFTRMYKPFDGDTFGKVISQLKVFKEFQYKELNKEYKSSRSPFNKVLKKKMKHYKGKKKQDF